MHGSETQRENSFSLSAKPRILLVEDDPAHRYLCQRTLQASEPGYQVEAASTVQEALTALVSANPPFSLILLDHKLPDGTGLEALGRIRELAPDCPVVMITGYIDDEFAVTSLRAGASDYLPKTVDYYFNLPHIVQTNLERQRLRKEVQQYQAQLTEKVAELEKATEQLRKMNALIAEAHQEKMAELAGLLQIYSVFNHVTDLKKLSRRLTVRTSKLVGAERCSLALYVEDSNKIIALTPSYRTATAANNHFPLESGSAAAQVLKTGQAFLSNDLTRHPYYRARRDILHSLLVVPLKRFQRIIGFLYAINKPSGFTKEDLRILSLIANQAAIGVENAKLFEKLHHLATTDELSGLANRRHFIAHLEIEIHRSQRNAHPFTLSLIDLDRLKQINDRSGHQAGDIALKHIAEVLRKSARAMDLPARLGGDEFALLLPETGKQRAQMVVERLCRTVSTTPVDGAGIVTISAGYATYPYDGSSAQELLRAADEALYAAKRAGRNRALAYHENISAA
ncbi:MAG: diguanylate cyclase [Acidobacteriota bacterium]